MEDRRRRVGGDISSFFLKSPSITHIIHAPCMCTKYPPNQTTDTYTPLLLQNPNPAKSSELKYLLFLFFEGGRCLLSSCGILSSHLAIIQVTSNPVNEN